VINRLENKRGGERSVKRFLMSALLVGVWVLGAVNAAYAVTLFTYDFEEADFADDVTRIEGDIAYYDFTQSGHILTGIDDIDLDAVLVGHDLLPSIEGAFGVPGDHSTKSSYLIEVLFKDNYLYNGGGPDLSVWERGLAEPFYMSIWNPLVSDWTAGMMFDTTPVGTVAGSIDVSPGVNIEEVDFALWGIPDSVQITRARFWSMAGNPNADLTAFGGLNSVGRTAVPEPTTFFLLGMALTATAAAARRFR